MFPTTQVVITYFFFCSISRIQDGCADPEKRPFSGWKTLPRKQNPLGKFFRGFSRRFDNPGASCVGIFGQLSPDFRLTLCAFLFYPFLPLPRFHTFFFAFFFHSAPLLSDPPWLPLRRKRYPPGPTGTASCISINEGAGTCYFFFLLPRDELRRWKTIHYFTVSCLPTHQSSLLNKT